MSSRNSEVFFYGSIPRIDLVSNRITDPIFAQGSLETRAQHARFNFIIISISINRQIGLSWTCIYAIIMWLCFTSMEKNTNAERTKLENIMNIKHKYTCNIIWRKQIVSLFLLIESKKKVEGDGAVSSNSEN